jgi:hypothetical protein
MSTVESSNEFILSTQIGTMKVVVSEVRGYDVEDIIHDRAVSQAYAARFITIGENIDINTPQGSRTIPSVYFRSGGLRNG